MALGVFSSFSLVHVVGLEHPQSPEPFQAVPTVISRSHYVLPTKKNPPFCFPIPSTPSFPWLN